MDLISEKSRKAAFDLIWVAENHYKLNLKGGLLALDLLRGGKAHKITHERAREEFRRIWAHGPWSSRNSAAKLMVIAVRAYELVPQNMLHETLDKNLAEDGLRIRKGQLGWIEPNDSRRLTTS